MKSSIDIPASEEEQTVTGTNNWSNATRNGWGIVLALALFALAGFAVYLAYDNIGLSFWLGVVYVALIAVVVGGLFVTHHLGAPKVGWGISIVIVIGAIVLSLWLGNLPIKVTLWQIAFGAIDTLILAAFIIVFLLFAWGGSRFKLNLEDN